MKNLAVLAMVGIFVFSVALSGCGKLSKKDFEVHTAQMEQEHQSLRDADASMSSKADQQNADLQKEIATKTETVRIEAITTAQEGDAETIEQAQRFATDEDAKLRTELTATANSAAQRAQDYAKTETDRLRQNLTQLEQQSNSQAQSINSLRTSVAQSTQEAKSVAESVANRKPSRVATINFASGRATLTDAAKQELNKAITAIKSNPSFEVKVVGHTDGAPVLSGRYRSNWDLSQARADAAAKYLKDNGVTNKIVAIARAHTQPVDPVNNSKEWASNRRVEVIIVPAATVIE